MSKMERLCRVSLQIGKGGRCGTCYGTQGRTFWDCTQLSMGCLGEGARLGKGGVGVILGERTTVGKIEGPRGKGGWLSASRWLDRMFFWPCSALVSAIWPVFSLNYISNCFLG